MEDHEADKDKLSSEFKSISERSCIKGSNTSALTQKIPKDELKGEYN